ncbi:hypothetical protein BDV18DRAFT_129554 [Aspergillus unguis]
MEMHFAPDLIMLAWHGVRAHSFSALDGNFFETARSRKEREDPGVVVGWTAKSLLHAAPFSSQPCGGQTHSATPLGRKCTEYSVGHNIRDSIIAPPPSA